MGSLIVEMLPKKWRYSEEKQVGWTKGNEGGVYEKEDGTEHVTYSVIQEGIFLILVLVLGTRVEEEESIMGWKEEVEEEVGGCKGGEWLIEEELSGCRDWEWTIGEGLWEEIVGRSKSRWELPEEGNMVSADGETKEEDLKGK